MKISTINQTNKNVTFAGAQPSKIKTEVQQNMDVFLNQEKVLRGRYKNAKTAEEYKSINTAIGKLTKDIETTFAKDLKMDKIPGFCKTIVKYLGKVKSKKTGNKIIDNASLITKAVLLGNVLKEGVGTTLYTIQAWTNEDLPKDKRKFVAIYDLGVGIVSTACSFIFGVALEPKIKNGYKKALNPLASHKNPAIVSRGNAAVVGIAAFTSFALQTIIGKRIVAPAIATPAAGRVKNYLEKADKAKNAAENKNEDANTTTKPNEKENATNIVFNKQKFIDLEKSKI